MKYLMVCLSLTLLLILGHLAGNFVSASPHVSENQTPVTAPASPSNEAITPGVPIEKPIRGGEKHHYSLMVRQGDFVRLVIESTSLTLAIEITTDDEKPLAASKNADRVVQRTSVFLIAETTGTYPVTVYPARDGCPPGRYQISVSALRTATDEDRERVAAQTEFFATGELLGKQTKEALDEGCQRYEKLIETWTRLGEFDWVANTIRELIVFNVYRNTVEPVEKLTRQVVELRRKVGDERGVAGALREMGILSFRFNQDFSKAKALFDEAMQVATRLGDVSTQASLYLTVGNIQKGLGANIDAIASYQSALAISKKSEDLYNQGIAINNLGTLYQKTGEFQKAAEYLQQSLILRRQQNDQFGERITLINLGHVFFDLNNFEQALASYTKALSLCSNEAKNRECIDIQMYIANTFTKNGQPARAISLLTEILEKAQKQGVSYEECLARYYLAQALFKNNEPEKTIECLIKLLPLLESPERRIFKPQAYLFLTRAYLLTRNIEAANEAATRGLAFSRTIGDKPTQMGLTYELAKLDILRGNLPEAKVKIEQALAILEQIRRDAGNIDAKTSYFTSVRELYDFYIKILMRLDQETPGGTYSREAFRCSELARARSLNERLVAAQVEIQVDDVSGLVDQVKRLREKLSNQQALLTKLSLANQPEAKTEPVRAQITGLEAELSQKLNQLYQQNPKLAQLQNPVILTAEEIQKTLLDPETVLVEFLVGPQEVFVWLVTADDITSFVIKDAEQVKHLGKRCVALLQPESSGIRFKPGQMTEFSTVSQQLSQLLFGPIESKLRNKKRLLVVADDILQLLPFAALPLPAPQNQTGSSSGAPPEPFVTRFEVVSLPSASTLANLRQEIARRGPAEKMIAVVADPVFSPDDPRLKRKQPADGQPATPVDEFSEISRNLTKFNAAVSADEPDSTKRFSVSRLPGTRREAQEILKLVPANQSFSALDFAASRELVTDSPELQKYRYLHFATHGFASQYSGLVLSLVDDKGSERNGFLMLEDLYNLKLNADLVTLSACDTGRGKKVRGEGIVGLTCGFLYAGVPRLVVSLWPVSDSATAELMTAFYQGLLREGLRPAAALRKAQLKLQQSKRWNSPTYWAAFQLQGEWR